MHFFLVLHKGRLISKTRNQFRATRGPGSRAGSTHGAESWQRPLTMVCEGGIVPGFEGGGITRTLEVHNPADTRRG